MFNGVYLSFYIIIHKKRNNKNRKIIINTMNYLKKFSHLTDEWNVLCKIKYQNSIHFFHLLRKVH